MVRLITVLYSHQAKWDTVPYLASVGSDGKRVFVRHSVLNKYTLAFCLYYPNVGEMIDGRGCEWEPKLKAYDCGWFGGFVTSRGFEYCSNRFFKWYSYKYFCSGWILKRSIYLDNPLTIKRVEDPTETNGFFYKPETINEIPESSQNIDSTKWFLIENENETRIIQHHEEPYVKKGNHWLRIFDDGIKY